MDVVEHSNSIRVLVVDDDQTVLDAINQKLKTRSDYRFDVHTQKSTDHLIEIITKVRPDVILLDNWIGGADEGLKKALPTIMGALPEQKVIVITSRRGGDTDQIMESRAWGAYTFIDKQGMWQGDLLVRRIVEAAGHKWLGV